MCAATRHEEMGAILNHALRFAIWIIVFMGVELMLNSCNLALIAFSRQAGTQDGQVFALVVMAIAASEVVIGLGLVVAMARRRMELDTDSLTALRD